MIYTGYYAHVDNVSANYGDNIVLKCQTDSSLLDFVTIKSWIRDDNTIIAGKQFVNPSYNLTGNQLY